MFTDGMLGFIHSNETKIEFSRMGHDHSLDFVKGLCILFVLLNHATSVNFKHDTLFYIWGYPTVPLFLLIQVFHYYKKGSEGRAIHLWRIWKRAVMPFLIVEAFIFAFSLIQNPMFSWRKAFIMSSYWGGQGPGCYYPWIYIQFALLLPLLRPLYRKVNIVTSGILFLSLSVLSEYLCSIYAMPEWVYRLLFLRYLFLFYLGYLLVEKGIVLNLLTLSLSAVSLVALYYFAVEDLDASPWFFYTEGWNSFHWICYFYIAYPMLFVLCKIFYRLPAGGWMENMVCSLGRHSYGIYIFQLFYFTLIAPYLLNIMASVNSVVFHEFMYVVISILACTYPVVRFIRNLSDRAVLLKIFLLASLLVGGVLFVIWQWRPFYKAVEPFAPYAVAQHDDDTLRVVMIGDSWAYFHQTLRRDSVLEVKLEKELGNKKVKLIAKGKGGTVSGEIYQYMSAERTMAKEYDLNNCLQGIIETGPDYCIISAGINDARQRRGKNYYVKNYMQIIRLLLANNIRPVVMEIPDAYVDEYYEENTLYIQLKARICMHLLKTNLYGVDDYRQALKDSLVAHHLMDSMLYIPAYSWNLDGWLDSRNIYTDDRFHLNLKGYEILDSTFAVEIVKDYLARKCQIH